MRKFTSLCILFLITAAVSGCGSHPAAPTPEPDKYTGEPTQMTINVQRTSASATSDSASVLAAASTDKAVVHLLRRNDSGLSIYEKVWEEPITDQNKTIPAQVPSEQGYEIFSFVYRGDRLTEAGNVPAVNAPAGKMTTATVHLSTPTYDLTMPDKLYSGGSLRQIVLTPLPQRMFNNDSVVLAGFNPWTTNGEDGLQAANPTIDNKKTYWVISGSQQLPEVTKPTKLYYQVALRRRVPPLGYPLIHWYDPDLDNGSELPYIWVYPYPEWQP